MIHPDALIKLFGYSIELILNQTEPDLLNTAYQDACWKVVVQLAGGVDYPE